MPKYRVALECRNEGGTDIHCYIVEGKDAGEAGYNATQIARAHYPEFDEIEPVRTEVLKIGKEGH